MSDHADLIARTLEFMRERPGLVDSAQELFLELLAALEAQPASLVADSREALAKVICDACEDSASDVPYDLRAADALLASGVVSVAGDRDRAVAEQAWDEGYRQGWADRHEDAQAGYVPSGFQQDTPNPYRESEGDPLYHGKPSKKGKRVYCEACNTWLPTNGNLPDVEIQEHEAELHD